MSTITEFLKEYFDWAAQVEKKRGHQAKVGFRMTTNNRVPPGPHSYASYAEGTLDFSPAQFTRMFFRGAKFYTTEPVAQYFSDRRFDHTPNQKFDQLAPFNPHKTDKIKLTISRSPITIVNSLSVTIEMVTWGGESVHFDAEIKAGMLVGMIDDNTVCTIAFTNKTDWTAPK